MRTEQEMLELILHKARRDDRIRGVLLSGSRVTESATHDKYSDFDIIYIVDGIQSFTKDKEWYKIFGEILIMQLPEDWYAHPYNYGGNENFAYLMQFTDGNRIDLTLIDKKNYISWTGKNHVRFYWIRTNARSYMIFRQKKHIISSGRENLSILTAAMNSGG